MTSRLRRFRTGNSVISRILQTGHFNFDEPLVRQEERRDRFEQKQFKRDILRAKKARQKKLDSLRK
jgi:hypothetical protein